MIEFQTLGPVELRGATGQPLRSIAAQPKRVALLAYLCVAAPRGFHRRDTLLALFWPESDQAHARTSLRNAIHVLRGALGPDTVISRGDEQVSINFQRLRCDAVAFDEAVTAGREQDAVSIYRGDFLAGFFIHDVPVWERWLEGERSRLRSLAAETASIMAKRAEAERDFAAAVRWATRAVELTGDDERAFRHLLELFDRADDKAGALGAYDAFVRRLKTEYSAEPSLETRVLAEGIRTRVTHFHTAAPKSTALNNSSFALTASSVEIERSRGRSGKLMTYGASALATLFLASILWAGRHPTPSKQLVRYSVVLNPAEALAEGASWWGRLAISPDGSRLAYIGGPHAQILIRPRSELHAIPMPGTEGAYKPFFSPSGEQLGFVIGKKLELASLNGGTPILVTDSLVGGSGASWGPDGFIYADRAGYGGLLRVDAKPGAVPEPFTALDTASGEVDHGWPDVLPNGKGALLTVTFYRTNGPKKRGLAHAIAVAEISSGKHRLVLNDAIYARYAAPGYLLYVTLDGPLMAVPFDQNSMKITGGPIALNDDLGLGELSPADLAVSAAGTLVYATGAGQAKQELVWVTRDGKTQSVDRNWQGYFWSPALSPDGKQLAIPMVTSRRTADVWIKQLDRGPKIKLTLQGRANFFPTWTADGRAVTFSSNVAGSYDLWTKRADGSEQAVFQFHEKRGSIAPQWSRDGKWLIYTTTVVGPGSADILGIRPGVDTLPVPLVVSKFTEVSPDLSPDSRWLAYASNETGGYEVYVVPFPNTSAAKWAVSAGGGTGPLWSHRGNELFYRDGAGNLVALKVRTNPTFSLGRSTVLFPATGFVSSDVAPMYAVSADDQRFLMIRTMPATAPQKLIVVENWFEELTANSRK